MTFMHYDLLYYLLVLGGLIRGRRRHVRGLIPW